MLLTGRFVGIHYDENNIMTFSDLVEFSMEKDLLTEKEFQRVLLNLGYMEKNTFNTKFSSSGSTCCVHLCVTNLMLFAVIIFLVSISYHTATQ